MVLWLVYIYVMVMICCGFDFRGMVLVLGIMNIGISDLIWWYYLVLNLEFYDFWVYIWLVC